MAFNPLVGLGTGAFGAGVGIQKENLERETKLEEVKWRMAAQMADHGINSWMKAYQENEVEVRKGNQIKTALVNNGIHPAVVDQFYDLHGNDAVKYIDEMRRAEVEDVTGRPDAMGGMPGAGTVPRSVKRGMPSVDTLHQPLSMLGMKQPQIDKMLAPYRAMQPGNVQQMAPGDKQFRVDMGPNNETRKLAEDAHKSVLTMIDRIPDATSAVKVFSQARPANVPEAQWKKLMPAYANMGEGFWGDQEQRRKMADEARREQAYKEAEQKMRGGDVVGGQAKLAGAGGMPPASAANIQPMPGGGMADPAHGAGMATSAGSTNVLPYRHTPNGPAMGAPISLEGTGPSQPVIVQAQKNIAANTAALQQLDYAAPRLEAVPNATGVVGMAIEMGGGLIQQIPGMGPKIDAELQRRGVDMNAITGVRTEMRALVERVGRSIQEDGSDRFSKEDRMDAQKLVRGLQSTASAGQTLEAWASIRRIVASSTARNIQLAHPAPIDGAEISKPEVQKQRLELFMRYGLDKRSSFELLDAEMRARGVK